MRRASEGKRENVQACLCVRVYVYARLRAAEPTCASDREKRKKEKETERERERRRELSSEPWEILCAASEERGAFRSHERSVSLRANRGKTWRIR